MPAACAVHFFQAVRARLLFGWVIGFLGCVAGLIASVAGDFPTGASIVTVFGLLLLLCAALRLGIQKFND